MSTLLYVLPWALWFAAFVALEAYGFRKGHDRWPTLSQLVKGWEDHTLLPARMHPTGEPAEARLVSRAGIPTWTWERWAVAAGIPIAAVLLELHWVAEAF